MTAGISTPALLHLQRPQKRRGFSGARSFAALATSGRHSASSSGSPDGNSASPLPQGTVTPLVPPTGRHALELGTRRSTRRAVRVSRPCSRGCRRSLPVVQQGRPAGSSPLEGASERATPREARERWLSRRPVASTRRGLDKHPGRHERVHRGRARAGLSATRHPPITRLAR